MVLLPVGRCAFTTCANSRPLALCISTLRVIIAAPLSWIVDDIDSRLLRVPAVVDKK
jgi:hypothetical protein